MTKKTSENLSSRGSRGGRRFPKYSLKHLFPFLESLIGKTHTSGIDIEQLNSGVFGLGAKSSTGKVKCSALKQFGLIQGKYEDLNSTQLSKKLAISEGSERTKLLREAMNNVEVFKNILETFQNSTTKENKIANYAVSGLDVHPNKKENFVEIFLESAKFCDLCTVEGDSIRFKQNLEVTSEKNEKDIETDNSEEIDNEDKDANSIDEPINPLANATNTHKNEKASKVNVNLDIDPSMDPEKLEKLLKLLKTYDAI